MLEDKNTKTVLCFFGTRPEAIKMIPVIKALKNNGMNCIVGISGQHTDMVDDLLEEFEVYPNFNLMIQPDVASIEDPTVLILKRLKTQIENFKPDLILVHGDTSTTLAGALSGFYNKIPVGHVEAGLRSFNLKHPWPEEGNRKLVGGIADYHFAPTKNAKSNLMQEGVPENKIILTGNTVVDALMQGYDLIQNDPIIKTQIKSFSSSIDLSKKLIVLTGHRKENLGEGIKNVFKAAMELSLDPEVNVIFPIHPNPKVRKSIEGLLDQEHNIKIVKPFNYFEMLWVLSKAHLLITDSGGLQEEAPSFNVPVLVTRLTTERREALDDGEAILVGTSTEKIIYHAKRIIQQEKKFISIEQSHNPFGNGQASQIISAYIQFLFYNNREEPMPNRDIPQLNLEI